MNRRHLLPAALLTLAAVNATPARAAKAPKTWDGMVLVKSRRFDVVYLTPGADFAAYTKVMLDPTEVSFHKNWRRDHNRSSSRVTNDVSEKDVQKVVSQGVAAANDLFAEAFAVGGYPITTDAGDDVVRVRTGVIDIRVAAPDTFEAGRSYTFTDEAGEATYFVELRDSVTGALLGRAADRDLAGDTTVGRRSRMTNRTDFRRLVKRWAEASVLGLTELKTKAPVGEDGLPARVS